MFLLVDWLVHEVGSFSLMRWGFSQCPGEVLSSSANAGLQKVAPVGWLVAFVDKSNGVIFLGVSVGVILGTIGDMGAKVWWQPLVSLR